MIGNCDFCGNVFSLQGTKILKRKAKCDTSKWVCQRHKCRKQAGIILSHQAKCDRVIKRLQEEGIKDIDIDRVRKCVTAYKESQNKKVIDNAVDAYKKMPLK